MGKNTLVFIALLSILFFGQLLLNEGFADTTFSSNPQARTHRIYAIALSMLKDVVYNPMMQYAINQPCLYNGSGWLALIQGPGSSLGVPSPTNPKWKAQPISSLTGIYSSLPAYADFSSIFNDAALESAFRGMQGSDLTPVYSAIVNALMYNPTNMYSLYTMCIHNGNMWSPSPSVREYQVGPTAAGMPAVPGSALGLPSAQNSNWNLSNPPPNIDPVLMQIIRNTGDGSSGYSEPGSAAPVTLNTESYEYYETTLLSSSGNEQYDTPNKYYESEAGIFYNGYLWSASKAGTMSSLGVPSDTNSNWKKMSIDEFVQIVTRQQGSNPKQLILDPTYIAALKQMTGFNYTPVYNAIINILKYNPSRMYSLTSLCIYDGKIWSPTLGNGTSGSSLGIPSQTNSNWKIYTGSSFAGTLLDKLIKDTAQDSSSGPGSSELNNPVPYQEILLNSLDLVFSPNKEYKDFNGGGPSVLYNGSVWFASKIGSGSSLGMPSERNPNWTKISIDQTLSNSPVKLDPIYVSALKQVRGFDYTPIYNALINLLMYDPETIYELDSICIYNGNMWNRNRTDSTGGRNGGIVGSVLGIPSFENSKWEKYSDTKNMDALAIQLVRNTAQGSASNQMPYQGIEGTNITGPYGAPIDAQFLASLKSEITSDVSEAVRDSLSYSNVMTDSCIDNLLNDQGTEFLKYIPGKNPADYIRKDSISCYGCSVP